jgi:hypothetical protein
MKKIKIPTIVGLLVLVASLSIGLLMFSQGTGVFSPRADEAAVPQSIKITNETSTGFSVSFYTSKANTSFVKYGEVDGKFDLQASDDRDQLSGNIGEYQLHHISVRSLKPATEYYFVLGNSDSKIEFDNQGISFKVKTTVKPTASATTNKTTYGTVKNSSGVSAEGSIVYVTIDGVKELSALVKSSGSWAISLSNAMAKDGLGLAKIEDTDNVSVFVQGFPIDQTARTVVSLLKAQPVEELNLGGANLATNPFPKESDFAEVIDNATGSSLIDLSSVPENTQVATQGAGGLAALITKPKEESTASAELDLTVQTSEPVVTSEQPVIRGKVAPNTQIKIEIHSDQAYETTVTSDPNGDFSLDTADLTEGLDPGEHSVTYSYIDPDTGEEVTVTETFMVEDPNLIAQADTSATNSANSTNSEIPYGSGNPYAPAPTSSVSATPTPTVSASTRSAVVSTDSGTYKSGSVETTLALIFGGIFFILTGAWSYWVASQLREK